MLALVAVGITAAQPHDIAGWHETTRAGAGFILEMVASGVANTRVVRVAPVR